MEDFDTLEFICTVDSCRKVIPFSPLKIEKNPAIECPHCKKQYTFERKLVDQFKKFEKLIMAVRDAKEILGNTSVGINVDGNQIKIPYKLLLTRMNTLLTLDVGGNTITFKFRVEPLKAYSE